MALRISLTVFSALRFCRFLFVIIVDIDSVINATENGTQTKTLTLQDQSVEALTDSNFATAIALWFSNESAATATYGHISDWDVSAVTNMVLAFYDRNSFNEDISGWNTSSVTNRYGMFSGATSFNQNIGSWNVGNVTDMYGMLAYATNFNQDISSWDVSSVTNMTDMFNVADSLSDTNKCAIHTSFDPQTSAWATAGYDIVWSTCPP